MNKEETKNRKEKKGSKDKEEKAAQEIFSKTKLFGA